MSISQQATALIQPKRGHQPEIECPACEYRWTPGKPRSLPQHKRFMAIIAEAYANWPETNERQFASALEFRKWLVCKAGYYDVTTRMPLRGVKPDVAIILATAAMQGAGAFAIATVHKGELLVLKPHSLRFDKMRPEAFCDLCDKVAAVIEKETGMRIGATEDNQ